MPKLNYGEIAGREVSERFAAPQATLTALKAIPANQRVNGMSAIVLADGSRWRFSSTSALTGDDLLVAAPSAGSGRWLREVGATTLAIPITYATADAAALLTPQAGMLIRWTGFAWKVTADFTGGSSSAIGVSSAKTGYTTKGDLLGGATGDVAATLVASSGLGVDGTIGAKFGTDALRRALWAAADTLRFDRITSAFTAGTGYVLASCEILNNDGA